MLPAVFSFEKNNINGIGWTREGVNIIYEKSDFSFKQNNPEYSYTLSFEIISEHDNDTILLASVPPYSYSRLISFLKETK